VTLGGYKQRQTNQNQTSENEKKVHYCYDFTKLNPESDNSLYELNQKLKTIPINSGFPITVIIDQEDTGPEKEMNEEFMLELIRNTHCCTNKLGLIDQMKDK
jgi:hypothetical protein